MRKLLVALVVWPLAAFAQGPGPGGGQGTGPGAGPERGAATRQGQAQAQGPRDPEKMQRRMRLARTLGLAEALDLDAPQALKLGDAIAKFDDRRIAAHRQLRDAHEVLRRAASGDKTAPADVDQAIQRALEARTQLQAIDRDVVATVTKDLTPDKKARAVLFLARFQHRFGGGGGRFAAEHGGRGGRMGNGNGMGAGMPGMGMGGGMGMGPGGMGQGGMMGMGPWEDDEDEAP